MDYANDGSLDGKELSVEKTINLGIELCKALEKCHSKGILHRDIKPQNILCNKDDSIGEVEYFLSDFGSAADLSEISGTLTWTPGFIAPEVMKEREWSFQSDVYALGKTLLIVSNLERERRNFSSEEKSLRDVLKKAADDDKSKRYKNMSEFKKALKSLFNRG